MYKETDLKYQQLENYNILTESKIDTHKYTSMKQITV